MGDETIHREHEMNALMAASIGEDEEEPDEWYRNVTERLDGISSVSNHYKSTITAITTLHEIIEEAMQHEGVGDLLVTMVTKQEQLFLVVVEFHRSELSRLDGIISDVTREVGGASPTGGYVNREKQLHSLQQCDEKLVQCRADLDVILEAPHPIEITTSPETDDGHTPSINEEMSSLHSQAQMLHLTLQSTADTLTSKLDVFRDNLQQERERFLTDLGDIEQWLSDVYGVLSREPRRDDIISYTPREVRDLQEEYSEEGVNTAQVLTLSEQVKLGDELIGGGIHREVSISGSSLGSDLIDLGAGLESLETSVDVDIEDDEYEKQVMERVLSGSDGSPSPSPSPLERPAQIDTSGESYDDRSGPFDDQVDPVGEQWAESMDDGEETDFQTETASISSGSTLREAPDRSPDPKRVNTELSEEEVNSEEVKTSIGSDEERDEEREKVGMSLADELGELGIELEQEISEKGVKSEDEPESEESGAGESGSEEGSEVSSEGVGLHWVARLRLLPMYCGESLMSEVEGQEEGEGDGEEEMVNDLDHIIQELEFHSSQLQSRNHKVKSAMANINFIINASPPATAQDLQARLVKVKVQWEPLVLHLKQRKQQLVFEKRQITALENLHEAVQELEAQPQNNLTYHQIQENYSQLMEFFQDVDSFEAQSRDHVIQLENTLQPLLGQHERLLGDGKGVRRLMEMIVESIREGYKLVEDQLKLQKANLEQWLEEWSTFHSALSQFRDWVGHAEGVASRDCYGNNVSEIEKFQKNITSLKAQLSTQEKKVEELVELGNVLLTSVGKGTAAETEVDLTLTDSETRWYNLVEKVESLESSIHQLLISWRAYSTIYHAARAFISQMTAMVGTEPVETSNGNITLLPTYRTYADQLRAFQLQYDKLLEYSAELTGNPVVGGRDSIAMETRELRSDWERLRDNVMDSLALLQREYDDWVHHQLLKMGSLVQKIGEIVAKETKYVEEIPLATFFKEDIETQMREAYSLIECQDELAQLEDECVGIDKLLLERATEQSKRQTLGDEDNPKNTENHLQLQAARDRYQMVSEAVLPVINIFYLQLTLLKKIHEGRKVVTMAMEAAGSQERLESLLTDINFSMSDDNFEALRGDAYDLGTVTEDCELDGQEQHGVKLPQYDQLVEINRSLTGEIEALSDESTTAKIRLQLFIEWWVEFHSNRGDITEWLEEAESRVDLLEARGESYEVPLVSPVELLNDTKELEDEMAEKEVVLRALESTSQNIVEEFTHDQGEGAGLEGEREEGEEKDVIEKMVCIKKRWNEIQCRLSVQKQQYEESSTRFNTFLTRFTSFCNWLCEMHGLLTDELCVAIPDRASEDTIAVHKIRLGELSDTVTAHRDEFKFLRAEGGSEGQWSGHLIPDNVLKQLPVDDSQPQSPVTMATVTNDDNDEPDFPFEEHLEQLPYFRTKIHAMTTKWGGVQRLLRDRENQLEMCLDNMVVFLEGVNSFLEWIRDQHTLSCLSSIPPADLTQLKIYQTGVSEISMSMKEQEPARLGLLRSANHLIGQLSGANSDKVNEKMTEIKEKWSELETCVETRTTVLTGLINDVEIILVRVSEFEGVLEEGDGMMIKCGPIGADLDRLVEQQEILDALDGDLIGKRKLPEELAVEAMNIIKDCAESSGEQLLDRMRSLQNRFDQLSENCYESRELCEEATAAMQAYQASEAVFLQWLIETDQKFTETVSVKKPIGTIHNESEEFLDYLKEIEQHTEQYGQLRSHGNKLAAKYKPSDALDAMMSSLHHKWEEFVSKLFAHFDKLHSLATRWDKYEHDVKSLLNWIMSEANRFSGELTTQGDKGIEDHILSCKTLSETLEAKKKDVNVIRTLAVELAKEDGEKSNGTCDVDSRWNDVNQHWTSLCKLLMETLIRLEATYAELQHVLLIRSDEFDWLIHCENEAADQHCCHGNVGRVEEEIVRQEQLLSEVEGHSNEEEFIRTTVEFLLEHTALAQREDIKLKADDFSCRYDNLKNSLRSYVGNLMASVPVWNEFNAISQELWEWLDHAHLQLNSDLTQPGNAIVTETSLKNVELLLEEVAGHQSTLHTLTDLTTTLTQLSPSDDAQYAGGVKGQLVSRTGDLAEQTQDRSDNLEQRLKSWQVFPVAEAQAVQAFLQQVETVMGGRRGRGGDGIGDDERGEEEEREVMAVEEEDLSCEQLLERLKRLEELQQLQQSNREKLTTINDSVEDEAIQAALERNPDISKERSNLLQGWSDMSEALSQQITSMKLKAEMMGELEGALIRVCGVVREYREEVEKPLPLSCYLEKCHEEIIHTQSTLHVRCQEEITGLDNLFSRISTNPDLEIPVRITGQAKTAREDFKAITEKAQQKTDLVAKQLEMWTELKSLLPRLFRWLRGAISELSCLRKIPDFATEFSSFESRMEALKDQITENTPSVDRLHILANDHITIDGGSHGDGSHGNGGKTLRSLKKHYTQVSDQWRALNEGIATLEVAMVPWKELTDRFDQIQDWMDGLRERVRKDISDLEQEDENSPNMSDYVVHLKDHLLKMEQHADDVSQLTNQKADLLSHDICAKHSTAHDLNEQISELEDMWLGQEQLLRHTLDDVEFKQAEWKRLAVSSIHKVNSLSLDLTRHDRALYDKDQEIELQRTEIANLKYQLQQAPPTTTPTSHRRQSSSFSFCIKFLVILLFIILALLVLLHDVGPHLQLVPLVFQPSTTPFKPI